MVDREESLRAVAADRLLSGLLDGPDVTRCYDNEVGSAVVVEGMIDSLAGQFSLGIRVWRIADRKTIFEERMTLTLTDRMRAAHLSAASHSDVAPLMSQDVALNYEHMQRVGGSPWCWNEGLFSSMVHLLPRRPVFQCSLEGENPSSRASLSGDCCRWVSNENIDNPRSSVWLKSAGDPFSSSREIQAGHRPGR